MKLTNLLSNDAVTREMGRRIAAARLERQMTQAQVAEAAGMSKRTIERLEGGQPTQVANLVRCLRALDKLEGLERLLPQTPISPIGQLKGRKKRRQRARPPKADQSGRATAGPPENATPTSGWTWGDKR
jgi:transcriptional regulator with XRE-family HTH domain